MKHFDTETAAKSYANGENRRRNGDEVYGLNGGYIVCAPEEADELVAAGVNLTIASPDHDESMDGDHESALESVFGTSENYDIDHHDDGGFFGWDE